MQNSSGTHSETCTSNLAISRRTSHCQTLSLTVNFSLSRSAAARNVQSAMCRAQCAARNVQRAMCSAHATQVSSPVLDLPPKRTTKRQAIAHNWPHLSCQPKNSAVCQAAARCTAVCSKHLRTLSPVPPQRHLPRSTTTHHRFTMHHACQLEISWRRHTGASAHQAL